MFNIFKGNLDGLAANGVDGYCMQLPYQGAILTGDLVSGFGGIGAGMYLDDDGNVQRLMHLTGSPARQHFRQSSTVQNKEKA